MSQISKSNTGGGGGGITSVLGQSSLVAPTITVTTVGTTATVENRAWETQYVVDPSAIQGLRGTFQTVQAAINQAVADGATLGTYKKIYIRMGTYTENLTIPSGIILVGQPLPQPTGGVITPYQTAAIVGNHTFTGTVVGGFEGVNFVSASGDTFTSTSTTLWYMDNCYFAQSSSDNLFNFSGANSYLSFIDCSFGATNVMNTSTTNVTMKNCTFPQHGICNISDGEIICTNCYEIGELACTGCDLHVFNCSFYEGIGTMQCISGTATGIISNCVFLLCPVGIANTISATVINCSNNSVTQIFETGIVYPNGVVQQGSIMYGTDVLLDGGDSDYAVDNQDHYIAVNNTVNPGTVTLPDNNTFPTQGQTFIIKDNVGNAATNIINVVVDNGRFIDNQTTQTIDQDYGWLEVRYDGTNYTIINSSKSAGSGMVPSTFTAYVSSTVTNPTGDGTAYTVIFDSTLNNTGNYNTGTGLFTAPATGMYHFDTTICFSPIQSTSTVVVIQFQGSTTSVRTLQLQGPTTALVQGTTCYSGGITIPMTMGDTMSVLVNVGGIAKDVSIFGSGSPAGASTVFSGYRVA